MCPPPRDVEHCLLVETVGNELFPMEVVFSSVDLTIPQVACSSAVFSSSKLIGGGAVSFYFPFVFLCHRIFAQIT